MYNTSFNLNDDSFCSLSSSPESSFHSTSSPLSNLLVDTFSNFPKKFYVLHINTQSVPAHYPDLLASFDCDNVHAILISETLLKPCLPTSSFSIPNFHLIHNDCIGKGGGGVAIYIRNHIPFTIVSKSPSEYSETAEHIFIEILLG